MVFQSYALFPHMTVLENVAYGPSVQGARRRTRSAMAMEKLALIGLTGLESAAPSELSGGQQQRVAVARALVLEPQVLLFDEPLSNLDAKLRRHVREEIRELQQSLGLTVAYVTHDQEEALAVSDRIIVMSNARIAQTGTPRELYEEPADLFVADFIGDANIVTGDLVEPCRPECAGAPRRRRPSTAPPGPEPGCREARRAPRCDPDRRECAPGALRGNGEQGLLSRHADRIRGGEPHRQPVRGAVWAASSRSHRARRSPSPLRRERERPCHHSRKR